MIEPRRKSDLATAMKRLSDERDRGARLVAAIERGRQDGESLLPEVEDAVAGLEALEGEEDGLRASITVIETKTGLNTLAIAYRAEQLVKVIEAYATKCAILQVGVVAAGGANRTTRNLFTGSKLFHSGGSIISFTLLKPDGTVLTSGVISCRSKEIRAGRDEQPLTPDDFVCNP